MNDDHWTAPPEIWALPGANISTSGNVSNAEYFGNWVSWEPVLPEAGPQPVVYIPRTSIDETMALVRKLEAELSTLHHDPDGHANQSVWDAIQSARALLARYEENSN